MTEQQRAFNPDRAAMAAVSSIEETMAIGRFGAQKSAQIQEIIVDTIRAALTHAEGEAFGWFTEDHDTDKSATTYDPVVADRWRGKGWPVWPLYTHPAPHCPVCMLDERDELRGEVKRLLAEAEYADRILRSSVPERHKGVTSPIGAVQNYIAELETAPQVAVPPEWSVRRGVTDVTDPAAAVEFVIETSTENGTSYITSVWLDDEDPAHRLLATMLAAPTAPAGELVTRCTAGLGCDEKGYCDAAATGQGDLCDRRTMAHEQPVSDPDGLPEPGRREAEQAYINGAFDYARDPIGSRDWILFWNGWQARDKSAPAPDEREVAALALERHADNLIVMAERDGRNNDRESQQTWEEAAYFAKQEAARLRAGKEGQ